MRAYLKAKLAEVLKLPGERIETDMPFASYGIDSIMAMALIRELERDLGAMPKTLFFEHEDIEELSAYLMERHAPPAAGDSGDVERAPAPMPAPTGDAASRMQAYLLAKLAEVLKLEPGRIETDMPFASYGIDSIMATALIRELEKDVGSLPKTLFFEYENIEELGAYLLERQQSEATGASATPAIERRPAPVPAPVRAPAGEAPRDMRSYLKAKLAEVLKLPEERIETDVPFASYGIDSIMAMAMIRELERDLGALPKTLFFEHEDIEELSAHLAERCAQQRQSDASLA